MRRARHAKSVAGYVQLALIFSVAAGAWLNPLEIDFFTDARTSIEDAAAEGGRSVRGFMATSNVGLTLVGSAEPGSRGEETKSQPVAAREISRSRAGCAISQSVHNGQSQPLSPIVLEFSFEDVVGQKIGGSMRAVVEEVLPAGAQGKFRFKVPCPKTFAAVKVQAIGQQVEVGANVLASASAKPPVMLGAQPIQQDNVAIQIPEGVLACPADKLCSGIVRLGSGKSTTHLFRRESPSSRTLISDARLAKQLRGTTRAIIELPLPDGGVRSVTIIKRNGNKWTAEADKTQWSLGAFIRRWT